MQLAIENSYGGKINLFVHPLNGFKCLSEEIELSIARMHVVPIEQTFFFSSIARLTTSHASCEMITCSESILCLERSSTSTGLNVPSPTWSVISGNCTPAISKRFINSLEKCNPAVGAATAPSFLA